MDYAPILIPTLCRAEHFKRCIESLKKNSWAKYTNVYVALDYPAKESHWEGYNKICEYLDNNNFKEFNNFFVIKRNENYGAANNMDELMKVVLDKYDFFIRSDDDAEFSPNFLEYINKVLWYYNDDPKIIGVTGYSYPVEWSVAENCNTFKMNFICPMWGTAFYTKPFRAIESVLENWYFSNNFSSIVSEAKYKLLTDARYLEFASKGLEKKKTLLSCASDVAFGTYMTLIDDIYIICPITSKVRNWGFDGTGVYCQNVSAIKKGKRITATNYDYSKQPIDESSTFEFKPDESTNCDTNKEILNNFDSHSKKELIIADMKILLYKLLGAKKYLKLKKLFSIIKKILMLMYICLQF